MIKRAGADPALSGAAHQLLGLMVNWADVAGRVRGKSVNYIAKATGRNRSTVIKALSQLCGRGYLERIGRHSRFGNGPNDYRLCFEVTRALSAVSREADRARRDKKRAPHHRQGREDATITVVSRPPRESPSRDTDNPDSFPIVPFRQPRATAHHTTVNELVTQLEAWVWITQDQIEAAYEAEARSQGGSKALLLNLLSQQKDRLLG